MCIDPILHICTSRGCSSVVERMLCMYEALGSIPSISNSFFIKAKLSKRMYANICLNKRPYALELCFHKYRSLCIIFIWNIRKAICAFDPILSVKAGDIAQWLDVWGPGLDPSISNSFDIPFVSKKQSCRVLQSKYMGQTGIWTRDLLHPKQDSYP